MLIQDPQSMSLNNVNDIYIEVKPFIHYLISKHSADKSKKGYEYNESEFNIGICSSVNKSGFNFNRNCYKIVNKLVKK